MRRYSLKRLWGILSLAFAVLLAGCGADSYVSKNYQLESASQQGQALQKIYRAENKSVPEVARELEEAEKPEEVSKESTQEMFLVYSDRLIHLQQDVNRPQDTIIEVDDRQFVKDNYDPSFLEGYLLASTLDRIFGSDWHFGKGHYGHYRGYESDPNYKPNPPTGPPVSKKTSLDIPKTVTGSGSFTRRSDLPSASQGQGTTTGPSPSGSDSQISSSKSRPSGSFSSPPRLKSGTGSFTRRR
jgi:hypothetical protein